MKTIIKQSLFIIFFLSGFLLWQNALAATTHYVSTVGSDSIGDGTSGSPWRTVQKCANSMSAGDTCSVAAGNYDEGVTIKVSGSNDANRSLFISTGGYAVVRYFYTGASYLTIDGFEITQPNGGNYNAITIGRVNVTTGATRITFQNCYVHDTVWGEYAISTYLTPSPTYVNIKNNIIKNVWGPAMLVAGDYWTIEGNTFTDIHSDVAYYSGDHHVVQDNTFKFVYEGNEGHHADFFQNIAETGGSTLTNFLVQRNKLMYGAGVQIGNFNNDSGCPGNNITFRNNIIYAITNPFNYAGCNSYFYNNTFVFAAMGTGANPISASTSQLTDYITFKNNLFIGNATEGVITGGGWYSAESSNFSNLTEGNNLVTAWPSSSFAAMSNFNTNNYNINGGDPKLANLPISAYPSRGFGMTGWSFEISTNPSWYIDNDVWSPGPGTGVNGGMWYSPGNVGWTYNSPWAYHSGGTDWTQFYAAHTSDGTGTLVYNNFTPVIGRRYGISMRPVNSEITGSITPSLGGQTGTTCNSSNIATSGWCPVAYVTPTTTDKLTFIPSNDFRNGLWQTSVWWSPGTSEYDISTSEKHSGNQSLHLQKMASGSTITALDYAGFTPALYTTEAWIKLVSGGIKFYVKDKDGNVTDIGQTTQTGSWIKISGDFIYPTFGEYFVFEATADNTEVYIDDVNTYLRFMSTNTIQYSYPQRDVLTVGSNVSINGDGICRTITSKNEANHYITFSPALDLATEDNAWMEAWGSRTNCSVDFRLTSDSTLPRSHGADLSSVFNDDITGNVRTSWDIGAYEYSTTGSDASIPAAPANLNVK